MLWIIIAIDLIMVAVVFWSSCQKLPIQISHRTIAMLLHRHLNFVKSANIIMSWRRHWGVCIQKKNNNTITKKKKYLSYYIMYFLQLLLAINSSFTSITYCITRHDKNEWDCYKIYIVMWMNKVLFLLDTLLYFFNVQIDLLAIRIRITGIEVWNMRQSLFFWRFLEMKLFFWGVLNSF